VAHEVRLFGFLSERKPKQQKEKKNPLEKVHAPERSEPSTRRTTSVGRDAPRACSPREPIAAMKIKTHISSVRRPVPSRRIAGETSSIRRRGHLVVTARRTAAEWLERKRARSVERRPRATGRARNVSTGTFATDFAAHCRRNHRRRGVAR
jgi:hypothetical protein